MKSKTSFHIFLFILTFFTLTLKERSFDALYVVFEWIYYSLTGLELFQDHTIVSEAGQQIWIYFQREVSYSIPLLTILFAHEMGHYVPARIYGIKATLPYFIPMPFGPIGTMGAVIKIEEVIPDKKKLFDIGVGGPLEFYSLNSMLADWCILFRSSLYC